MRDWQELVRQRLDGLALDSTEREAVYDELAGPPGGGVRKSPSKGFA